MTARLAPSRKRLCIVTPVHSPEVAGGAEYQIACLIDRLAAAGEYEMYYLARRLTGNAQPANYRVVQIGRDNSTPRFGYSVDAAVLCRTLRKIDPHVIYQRVGCAYTGIAAYYARRSGARLVWHIAHDNDVMHESLRDRGNPVRLFLEKKTLEYGIRHAGRIVAQTRQQAALLERNYGREADAIVRNFHPAPLETIDKSGMPTVVWVANLKRWKQPEVFVRLAARLHDLPGARFLIVGTAAQGSGDREWGERVMHDIANTSNIEYLGWRSLGEVNEILANAHVFVNTSRFEGFPNTFIQAWMREVPVVSLHVNPDGILDREAIGIHAGTEEGLAHAVRLLLTDAARRTEYATRAREYAMRAHSLRNVEVLESVLAGE